MTGPAHGLGARPSAPRAVFLRLDTARVVALTLTLALSTSMGCSTLGTPGGVPEGLPHGGTGPFRDLRTSETRLGRAGTAVLPGDVAVERATFGGLHLFYAAAAPLPAPDAGPPDAGPVDAGSFDGGRMDGGSEDAALDDAGTANDAGAIDDAGPADDAGSSADAGPDAGPIDDAGPDDAGPGADAGPPAPAVEVDWALYLPRSIYRSAPNRETFGFPAGSVVLESSEPWEGGYVADPWALELEGGRTRLYYAAAGGIGVAEASSIDGTFTTMSSAPILGAMGGAVPRCPTVVPTAGLDIEGAFLMLYELDGTIRSARSDDGLTFTDLGEITILRRELDGAVLPTLPPRDRRDGNEVSRGCPAALVAHTPAGRSVLRVYYESRRDNGAALLGMLGTTDGETFEAYALPVVLDRDRRMPGPHEVDGRITLLLNWRPRLMRDEQRGDVAIGVAPGGITLTGGIR